MSDREVVRVEWVIRCRDGRYWGGGFYGWVGRDKAMRFKDRAAASRLCSYSDQPIRLTAYRRKRHSVADIVREDLRKDEERRAVIAEAVKLPAIGSLWRSAGGKGDLVKIIAYRDGRAVGAYQEEPCVGATINMSMVPPHGWVEVKPTKAPREVWVVFDENGKAIRGYVPGETFTVDDSRVFHRYILAE